MAKKVSDAGPGDIPGYLVGQLRDLTGNLSRTALRTLSGRVGSLTLDVGRTVILDQAQRRLMSKEQRAWMTRAGEAIADARRTADMSREDLAGALDFEDKTVIEAIEHGSATLSFNLILRLTSLLARNDPIPFFIQLVRGFNPRLWALAEDWGVGRLPVMVERDRTWMNIYRGNEAARQLPEAEFNEVMRFCESALQMALRFKQSGEAPKPTRPVDGDDAEPPNTDPGV